MERNRERASNRIRPGGGAGRRLLAGAILIHATGAAVATGNPAPYDLTVLPFHGPTGLNHAGQVTGTSDAGDTVLVRRRTGVHNCERPADRILTLGNFDGDIDELRLSIGMR